MGKIYNLDQWFMRRCHLKKKFSTTHRRRTKTNHNSSPGVLNKQLAREERAGCFTFIAF